MTESSVKLLIVVASGRGWASRFGHKLASLTLHLGMTRLGGRLAQCAIQVHHGAYLVKARNDHMVAAIAGGFTHMLSLDDDMTFPADCVDRMLAHDLPVVTCNYRKKIEERIEFCCSNMDGGMVVTHAGKSGLEQVSSMGMGLTLIDIEKVKHVPGPYFAVIWNETTGEHVIEDGVFSALLQEHGVELWCDHDVSKEVGHVGEIEFTVPKLTSLELVSSRLPAIPQSEKKHEVQVQAFS